MKILVNTQTLRKTPFFQGNVVPPFAQSKISLLSRSAFINLNTLPKRSFPFSVSNRIAFTNRVLKKTGPTEVREKLDPRLAYLLSLDFKDLVKLKEEEDKKFSETQHAFESFFAKFDKMKPSARDSEKVQREFQSIESKFFSPLTFGFFLKNEMKLSYKYPYIDAFIKTGISAIDLARIGVHVRSQSGDIFTAYIPLRLIKRLEASPLIEYIQLSRPLFSNLNQVVPFAQIDTLHNANPAVDGTGVVVGVIDTAIDIYHPDFRDNNNNSRIRFLWDQTITPNNNESSPINFNTVLNNTYGVEYTQANINAELTSYNPPATPAYQTVRHAVQPAEHGTHVASIATGNGRGQNGTFVGGAPRSDIIFVKSRGLAGNSLLTSSTWIADGCSYIFARAQQLNQPCVINISKSDNQGPHDGSDPGEQFFDNLLSIPGRAITVSAGNSTTTAAHASGNVAQGQTQNLVLNYRQIVNPQTQVATFPTQSDNVEIWYDGHDNFSITLTAPTQPPTFIGPIVPGQASQNIQVAPNIQVQIISNTNDPRNGDNMIAIFITSTQGATIPLGNWNIALTGNQVINGNFHAWVDRNNRFYSSFQPPFLNENGSTLGMPSTAYRVTTVGNHDKTTPIPVMRQTSGRGPTRDGRIKPEIAAGGTGVNAANSRNMNTNPNANLYVGMTGTSMSAPLVAGAYALLFQCRGAQATWADLKQIIIDNAGTNGVNIPDNGFGFGFLQMATGCSAPLPNVDVWMRDELSDTGLEPFTGTPFHKSPDISVLDDQGNPVPNPIHDPSKRFSNIIEVTVRNRGTETATNIDTYLYWADPATNIPFPDAWSNVGIFTDPAPNFTGGTYTEQGNKIVIPELGAGQSTTVRFGWAPPQVGSNIRGDDHFCLLARVEQEQDPSNIGTGGFNSIPSRNNLALRNVNIQKFLGDNEDAICSSSFWMEGSADTDTFIISTEGFKGGLFELTIPTEALPIRDAEVIQKYGNTDCDMLKREVYMHTKKELIHTFHEIRGADMVSIEGRTATVSWKGSDPVIFERLRLPQGKRLQARISVQEPKLSKRIGSIDVEQLSGGRRLGGVSLEIHS